MKYLYDPIGIKEGYSKLFPGGHIVLKCSTKEISSKGIEGRLAGFELRDTIAYVTSKETLFFMIFRKPLEGTIANNVLKYGCGGLNVDGTRIGGEKPLRENTTGKEGLFGMGSRISIGSTMQGRWPANVILEESEDVVDRFPVTTSGGKRGGDFILEKSHGSPFGDGWNHGITHGDSGSASRFFKHCNSLEEIQDYFNIMFN